MDVREKLVRLMKEQFYDEYEFEEIADDLISQGVTVQKLKIGDVVYKNFCDGVYEATIRDVIYDAKYFCFDGDEIGKTVFLTKREAESALP